MLARITGAIESVSGPPQCAAVVLPASTPDVAYEVLIPAYLVERLQGARGASVTLHTLQYLESQNQGASFIPRLLGFASAHEREFFELLTSVKGLGNKRAMRAMAVEPARIARAIAERDANFLRTLPEIGPKLAELIVHELRGKTDRFALDMPEDAAPPSARRGKKPETLHGRDARATEVEPKTAPRKASTPAGPNPPIRQTVDALVALGESPLDAERMVARAIDRARAAGEDVPRTPDELLTAAYAVR